MIGLWYFRNQWGYTDHKRTLTCIRNEWHKQSSTSRDSNHINKNCNEHHAYFYVPAHHHCPPAPSTPPSFCALSTYPPYTSAHRTSACKWDSNISHHSFTPTTPPAATSPRPTFFSSEPNFKPYARFFEGSRKCWRRRRSNDAFYHCATASCNASS